MSERAARFVSCQELIRRYTVISRSRERGEGLRQSGTGGGANRRVLLSNELLRLRRPGHELAVQANPIGLQAIPEPGPIEPIAHQAEHITLDGVVVEEATPSS